MTRTVKLSRVGSVLKELSYPLTRTDAATQLEGITLTFADGEDDLGGLVSETDSDTFASAGELQEELYGHLPVEASGEPGQAEGEG